jgi:hypothetical protein
MWLQHLMWFPVFCLRLTVHAILNRPGARVNLRGVGLALCRKRRANRRAAVVGDRGIFARFSEMWQTAASGKD